MCSQSASSAVGIAHRTTSKTVISFPQRCRPVATSGLGFLGYCPFYDSRPGASSSNCTDVAGRAAPACCVSAIFHAAASLRKTVFPAVYLIDNLGTKDVAAQITTPIQLLFKERQTWRRDFSRKTAIATIYCVGRSSQLLPNCPQREAVALESQQFGIVIRRP